MSSASDSDEPVDPHAGSRRRMPPVVLVALGGALGSIARYLLGAAIPRVGELPVDIFVINIVGAFLLGLLIETLVVWSHNLGRRQDIQLFVGTGVFGGFTTYSALAVDTAVMLQQANIRAALIYSIGTVVLGAVATAIGVLAGHKAVQRRWQS